MIAGRAASLPAVDREPAAAHGDPIGGDSATRWFLGRRAVANTSGCRAAVLRTGGSPPRARGTPAHERGERPAQAPEFRDPVATPVDCQVFPRSRLSVELAARIDLRPSCPAADPRRTPPGSRPFRRRQPADSAPSPNRLLPKQIERCLLWQRTMRICRDFYRSDGTRTRDLRRDRPVR
jgi:hypothetical protein